jgi:hypothetical protein
MPPAWALLPLVARTQIVSGPGLYGILLGAIGAGGPPITFDPAARGSLHGVRILDLSRFVAGNMLSLQLADFGADVIKVEPPGGDPLRDWRESGHVLHWKVYARNKRSIVLAPASSGCAFFSHTKGP